MGTHNITTNLSYIQILQSTMNFNTNHQFNDSVKANRMTILAIANVYEDLALAHVTEALPSENQQEFNSSLYASLEVSIPLLDTEAAPAKVEQTNGTTDYKQTKVEEEVPTLPEDKPEENKVEKEASLTSWLYSCLPTTTDAMTFFGAVAPLVATITLVVMAASRSHENNTHETTGITSTTRREDSNTNRSLAVIPSAEESSFKFPTFGGATAQLGLHAAGILSEYTGAVGRNSQPIEPATTSEIEKPEIKEPKEERGAIDKDIDLFWNCEGEDCDELARLGLNNNWLNQYKTTCYTPFRRPSIPTEEELREEELKWATAEDISREFSFDVDFVPEKLKQRVAASTDFFKESVAASVAASTDYLKEGLPRVSKEFVAASADYLPTNESAAFLSGKVGDIVGGGLSTVYTGLKDNLCTNRQNACDGVATEIGAIGASLKSEAMKIYNQPCAGILGEENCHKYGEWKGVAGDAAKLMINELSFSSPLFLEPL